MPKSVKIDLNRAKELYNEGNSIQKIAIILNCDRTTLGRKLKADNPNIGYSNKKIIVGDTFANGVLTVLEELEPYKSGFGLRKQYKVHCSKCNSVTNIKRQDLVKTNRMGCNGCRKSGNTHFKWQGTGDISAHFFSGYRRGAIRRNIPFYVTIDQCWQLYKNQNGKCALTGIDITFDSNSPAKDRKITASLDRIDNNGIYEVDNLRWVHVIVQFMRQDYSDLYFGEMCERVFNYSQSKHGSDNLPALEPRVFAKDFKGFGNIHKTVWDAYKNGAKYRNYSWDISIEYGWNLFLQQRGICALSGLPIDFAPKITQPSIKTASLDRIDSSIGYVENNIQWVHKDVNLMKGDLSNQDYIHWCSLIVGYGNSV